MSAGDLDARLDRIEGQLAQLAERSSRKSRPRP
jgi:hypothetical protein